MKLRSRSSSKVIQDRIPCNRIIEIYSSAISYWYERSHAQSWCSFGKMLKTCIPKGCGNLRGNRKQWRTWKYHLVLENLYRMRSAEMISIEPVGLLHHSLVTKYRSFYFKKRLDSNWWFFHRGDMRASTTLVSNNWAYNHWSNYFICI